MSGFLSDVTSIALEKSLNVAGERHRVIANNIANVNTPNFKRSYVDFEGELKRSLGKGNQIKLRRTNQRHLGAGSIENLSPQIKQDRNSVMRADGNNVDIDLENAELAINTIMYNAAATRLNQKLGQLRYVINGGR
ncbi:MAG: flagellar basal body rod protein FlgB [Bacillota bacterium]